MTYQLPLALNLETLAKTKAELAVENNCSTQYISRILYELSNAELVSKQKRGKDRGRPEWEFWKTKIPEITELKMISETFEI